MKTRHLWIDDEEKTLKINLESETQEESCELIQYAKQIKLPVKVYGKVEKDRTWIWIQIPIKSLNYRDMYFGNDKDVVK